MALLKRFLLALILTGPLVVVVFFVPYPKNWQEASIFQILSLFSSLLLTATALCNVFFNYLPRSFIAGLGIMIAAFLQALGYLNFVSGPILLIIVIICIRFFPKLKVHQPTDIPKLKKIGKKKS